MKWILFPKLCWSFKNLTRYFCKSILKVSTQQLVDSLVSNELTQRFKSDTVNYSRDKSTISIIYIKSYESPMNVVQILG